MSRTIARLRVALVSTTGVLALLCGAGTAGAQGPVADISTLATASSAITAEQTADDPVVDQIIAETGVSRTEAVVRARVESLSGSLAGTAAGSVGARWGGLTVGTDSVLTLRVVGLSAADRTRITALVGAAGIPTGRVRLVTARFSQADLTAAAARVGDSFAAQHPTTAFSVSPSVAGGEVQLQVATGAGAVARSFVARSPKVSARAGSAQVPVRVTGEQAIGTDSCSSLGKCDPVIRGGQQIINPAAKARCTAGFVARSKSDHSKKFLVTAGHCTLNGGNWNGVTADGSQKSIGRSVKTTWRSGGDLGLISIANKTFWKPNYGRVVVYKSDLTPRSEKYRIRGIGVSQVGQRVCHTGSTTGTRCGRVVAIDERIRYCDPKAGCKRMVTVNDVTRGTDRVIPGDSGGPRFASNRAYGITSGHAEAKVNGRTVRYSLAVEASTISSSLGVELLTT